MIIEDKIDMIFPPEVIGKTVSIHLENDGFILLDMKDFQFSAWMKRVMEIYWKKENICVEVNSRKIITDLFIKKIDEK